MIAAVLTVAFICCMSTACVLIVVRIVDGRINWRAMGIGLAITYLMAGVVTLCTFGFVALLKRYL